jgi:uncharacterized zinc-type alcohol dehydrogenase-like protein
MYCKPTKTRSIAALSARAELGPHEITRRACTENDVVIAIKYAGICHSDIHQVREEWGAAIFPMVPGHEIAGVVEQVGSNVTNFAVGETVGVGCMVDSCRKCQCCKAGDEQYCQEGMVGTYNSRQKYPHCAEFNAEHGGAPTYGGYSTVIVVNKDFVLHIPVGLSLAGAAPLLCAGITTYSPLIHFGLQPNHRFGVVGLGGLGHMAAKFGHAFGAHTTVISRGTSKKESALNELHADSFLDSTDAAAMKAAHGTYDMIINTVSARHDIDNIIKLLKHNGTLIVVGAPPEKMAIQAGLLIGKRVQIAGSLIGGVQETQDMLDFCGRHNITCDVEVIDASRINEAYERTLNADVKYRFVIDTATI